MTKRVIDPVNKLLWNTKARAKRRGIPFSLTAADITIPVWCPVLGIPLYRNTDGKAQGPNSPTLDRLDPAKGYVPGNVAVVSARANQIKSNATPQELLRVAFYFTEHGPQEVSQ